MDVSRTCFSATKMVPMPDGSLAPRQGMYYFLEHGVEFLQRSQLGGHWFEGKPFQTGDYATSMLPKPQWVTGAIPNGAIWPPVHCCGLLWEEFTCTKVTMHAKRLDTGAEWTEDAHSIGQAGGLTRAIWDWGLSGRNIADLWCDDHPSALASSCPPPGDQPLEVFIDPEIESSDYRVSLRGASKILYWRPPAFTTCALADVRFDFYGTSP